MAYILLPSRWIRQPQYPVELRSRFVSPGSTLCLLPPVSLTKNLSYGPDFSIAGTPTRGVSPAGVGFIPGTGGAVFTQAVDLKVTEAFFVVLQFFVRSSAGTLGIFALQDTITDGTPRFIYQNNGGDLRAYINAGYRVTESGVGAANTLHTVVIRNDGLGGGSGSIGIHRNGAFRGSYSPPGSTANDYPYFGNGFNGSADVVITLGVASKVLISQDEATAISASPYGELFSPVQRRIYVPSAGGGAVTAVGSSAGVATASATGASLRAASGASTGAATAAATGASLSNSAGSSAGVATAAATGFSSSGSVGASDGVATAAATGVSTAASVGASDGVATASAVGESVSAGSGVGESAGIGAASATGASLFAAAGLSEGIALASGIDGSLATVSAVGTSAGTSTVSGFSPSIGGETASVGAGGVGKARKPSTRRRKPILINVDGEEFVVSSEAEAVDLIEKAREAAEVNARAQSAAILEKRKLKAARDGKLNTTPLRLDEPSITVTPAQDGYVDRAWVAQVDAQINDAIRDAYESAARDAETQLLLAQRIMVDEEDALVALLLTL